VRVFLVDTVAECTVMLMQIIAYKKRRRKKKGGVMRRDEHSFLKSRCEGGHS